VFPSDVPGVKPATLNGMLLYYRLMTKWSGLGDSTELSRMGLSQRPRERVGAKVSLIIFVMETRAPVRLLEDTFPIPLYSMAFLGLKYKNIK
jgi:hypothetical protein